MECFVCGEEHLPLYRMCKCDMCVHESCFRKLLSVPSHSHHCAICLTPYTGVKYVEKKICKPKSDMLIVLFSLIGIIILCLVLTRLASEMKNLQIIIPAYIASAIFIGSSSYGVIRILFQHRSWIAYRHIHFTSITLPIFVLVTLVF